MTSPIPQALLERIRDQQERAAERLRDYVPRRAYAEGKNPAELLRWRRLMPERSESDIITDKELTTRPRTILIGNAGAGKSWILRRSYLYTVKRFLADNKTSLPFLLDCGRDLSSRIALWDGVELALGKQGVEYLRNGTGKVIIYIDALDEGTRHKKNFLNDVSLFLGALETRTEAVVMTCRRTQWEPDRPNYSKWAVYNVDYLETDDYAHIIKDDALREQFFEECEKRRLNDLLGRPFDGFYLALEFKAGRPLPANRPECFDRRINAGIARARKRSAIEGEFPVPKLRQLAARIAAISAFTEERRWTTLDLLDNLNADTASGEGVPVTGLEIDALVESPIFYRNGEYFGFSHDLFGEYLAAEALEDIGLRRQRILLETPVAGIQKIAVPFRGIAMCLAERSRTFWSHVVEHDYLVAALSEAPPCVTTEAREDLLRTIIGQYIKDQKAPWWNVPPRGERLADTIKYFRPLNPKKFLKPYVDVSGVFEAMWVATCAELWGGVPELNDHLISVALNEAMHDDARASAILAIKQAGKKEDTEKLYPLLRSKHDELRGLTLSSYVQEEKPSPRDFIEKLRPGPARNNLYCSLQGEAQRFWDHASEKECLAGFEALEDMFDDIGTLRNHVFRGLLRRILGRNATTIPPRLVWRFLERYHMPEAVWWKEDLDHVLRDNGQVFEDTVNLGAVRGDTREKCHFYGSEHPLARNMTKHLQRIKGIHEASGEEGKRFVEELVQSWHAENPTKERARAIEQVLPSVATRLPSKKPMREPTGPTAEEITDLVMKAIDDHAGNVLEQCDAIMTIAKGPMRQSGYTKAGTRADLLETLTEAQEPKLRERMLTVFRNTVDTLAYCREDAGDGRFTVTEQKWAAPCIVLHRRKQEIPAGKLADVVRCYGFFSESEVPMIELLETLREQDPQEWEDIVLCILEREKRYPGEVLAYLTECRQPLYLKECKKRLRRGLFDDASLVDLLDYHDVFATPETYKRTVRGCYRRLVKERSHMPAPSDSALRPTQNNGDENGAAGRTSARMMRAGERPTKDEFLPLLRLMNREDDWAWEEFERRLDANEAPTQGKAYVLREDVKVKAKHVPILVKWFVQAWNDRERERPQWERISGHLQALMERTDLSRALQLLKDKQRSTATAGTKDWLSFPIMELENAAVKEVAQRTPMDVVKFLDCRTGGMRTERDLFEITCEAIEDIQREIEKEAIGVEGFWNGREPKDETGCQNSLWQRIRDKMNKYGVADIEERQIGRKQADFSIVFPLRNKTNLEVITELKVARKGYGKKHLIEPIENQLWERYMRPRNTKHGIYVVLWFQDPERYKWPTGWKNKKVFERALKNQTTKTGKQHSVTCQHYVIDVTSKRRGSRMTK